MGEQNEIFSLGLDGEKVRKGFLERVAKLWRKNGDYQDRWITGEEKIEIEQFLQRWHLLNKYLVCARHVLISSDLEVNKMNSISNISKYKERVSLLRDGGTGTFGEERWQRDGDRQDSEHRRPWVLEEGVWLKGDHWKRVIKCAKSSLWHLYIEWLHAGQDWKWWRVWGSDQWPHS